MSGFVYIWFDKKHKRYYIGSHWGSPDDGYICSSNSMNIAYKRNPQDFKRRIIKTITTTRRDLLTEEYRYLAMVPSDQLGRKYYNKSKGKFFPHWSLDDAVSEDTRKKISIKTKEAIADPIIRDKYLKGLATRGPTNSPEGLEKRKQSMIKTMAKKFPVEDRYRPQTNSHEEYIELLSQRSKELWQREGHREKAGAAISKALTGKPHPHQKPTKEQIEKIRQSNIGYKWWTNGISNVKSRECPEGYYSGMIKKAA